MDDPLRVLRAHFQLFLRETLVGPPLEPLHDLRHHLVAVGMMCAQDFLGLSLEGLCELAVVRYRGFDTLLFLVRDLTRLHKVLQVVFALGRQVLVEEVYVRLSLQKVYCHLQKVLVLHCQ
jgi:hypothetical protein